MTFKYFVRSCKFHKFSLLREALIFLIIFLCFGFMYSLTYSFFENIYVYAYGFSSDCYYSFNGISSSEMDSIPESDLTYYCEYSSIIVKDRIETSFYTNRINEISTGVGVNNRLFISLSVNKESDITGDLQLWTSNPLLSLGDSVSNNNKDYKVTRLLNTSITKGVKDGMKASGISDADVNIYIDKTDSHSRLNSLAIVRGNYQAIKDDSSFVSGKDLNDSYKTGFNLYAPLIYFVVLIPLSVSLIGYSQIMAVSLKSLVSEMNMYRLFGLRKSQVKTRFFLMNLTPMLVSYLVFALVYYLVFHFAYGLSIKGLWIVLLSILCVSLLFLFFFSQSKIKTISIKGEKV